MLISPPFLPPRASNQTENQWLDKAMPGGEPGYGSYPVSDRLAWHGGLHLRAPTCGDDDVEPVRAIADGIVVYRRGSTEPPAAPDPKSALRYQGRTSDGVVVIRHETDIGAACRSNTSTRVVFFSVYVHMHTLRTTVQPGRSIHRKDELGQAGYIRGQPHQIHFEIICDDANLKQLIGRNNGVLPLNADGRSDVIFGELYFYLEATALVYAQRPPQPHSTLPGGVPLGEALIVGLRYAEGEGVERTRGHAYVTTYGLAGALIGESLTVPDAEYNIYRDANDISETYPAHARPVPSAVYELLRFGRVVGADPLVPEDVPHWRQIRTRTGSGWVNLNAPGVRKFSDADFPQWRGWFLVTDVGDGRCNDAAMMQAMDVNRDGAVTADEMHARLDTPSVRSFLKPLICKLPTEWDAAVIDARWGWLKTASPSNSSPLQEEQFARLRAHIHALAFWQQANLRVPQYNTENESIGERPLPSTHWHFNPREFIRAFRKCGWLSLAELARLIPRRLSYSQQGRLRIALEVGKVSRATAAIRLKTYALHLNWVARKYGISSARHRFAHFFAQTIIETDHWQVVYEYGRGAPHPKIPMAQYYAAFYGRGIMQLTWAGNYESYGLFRNRPHNSGAYVDHRIGADSRHYWWDPTLRDADGRIIRVTGIPKHWAPRFDPTEVEIDSFIACDSGGYYWVAKSLDKSGKETNINRVADEDFNPRTIGRVNVLVNGGGNGYYERQAYAQYGGRILFDNVETASTRDFLTPRNGVTVRVDYAEPT